MALNSGQPVVRYNVNGCEFEVDVANMVQTNLETGERWMIAVEETQTEQKGATDQASTAAPDKTETAATEATEVPPEETAFAAGASEPRQVPTATGRPKAFIYKAIPDPSRPPPKQKKWSLAPGGQGSAAAPSRPARRTRPSASLSAQGCKGISEAQVWAKREHRRGALLTQERGMAQGRQSTPGGRDRLQGHAEVKREAAGASPASLYGCLPQLASGQELEAPGGGDASVPVPSSCERLVL
ncbi:unnamed protein product [Durusdinium trenchii]|uniref:Uncharacterized protein n=1 Tax=Durusdinium trenchii TaxID=1381693 RepID=A0ABP0PT65_9DINO